MDGAAGTTELDFLRGGGFMGAAIRGKDWSATPLGPPERWPAPLRMVVRLMLTTNHPIFVFWGEALTCLYNDPYSHSIGPERHPGALGRPGREVWAEIWDIIGPQVERVMRGEGATWHRDHLVPITRHGRREDVYWTYSYSPIDDPSAPSGVGGVLVICTETTRRIETERALAEEVRTKEILLREVNHRIKNCLQFVAALLRIEARGTVPEARAALIGASRRLEAVGGLHELIYRADAIDSVPMQRYLADLCGQVAAATLGGRPDIAIRCEADALDLPADLAIATGVLVNELVTNALKHAFPAGRGGTIRVRAVREGAALLLSVADDGIGRTGAAEDGMGSQIVTGLVRQVRGSLSWPGGGPGHAVEIRMPLPVQPAAAATEAAAPAADQKSKPLSSKSPKSPVPSP